MVSLDKMSNKRRKPKRDKLIMVQRVPVFQMMVSDIDVGTMVYVVYAQHPKHLELGKVVRKVHGFYQVEFNDESMWLSAHWIEKCPW